MSLDTLTKLAIYRHFAETGQRPSLEVVAESVGSDVSSVREAYARLRAQRVLVLEPDGVSVRIAPPFSGVQSQHVVIVEETKYFANCAWDAFGIPAALHRQGRVHSRCEQSGEPLSLEIGLQGPPPCSGFFIALFPRPNGGTTLFSPETTCLLFFRSEERVREWCAAHGYPMRPLVTMEQLWTLATTWYSTRLQENSRRPQPDEMRSIFASLGLGSDFWNPQFDSFG
jgi:hypothetical protein